MAGTSGFSTFAFFSNALRRQNAWLDKDSEHLTRGLLSFAALTCTYKFGVSVNEAVHIGNAQMVSRRTISSLPVVGQRDALLPHQMYPHGHDSCARVKENGQYLHQRHALCFSQGTHGKNLMAWRSFHTPILWKGCNAE
eukprot:6481888-Amphidinium_carterae.1